MLLFLLLIITITSTVSNENNSDQPFQPKFDKSFENVSVVVGKRAMLPCYVSLQDVKNNGFSSFKIVWMKLNNSSILTMADRSVNGDSRISLVHTYAEEWNLQIDDIDEDDAGVYQCIINNGMYKSVLLEVKVPPRIIDELTTEPYPYPIRSGSNFTIKCYAHGKPTPNIRIIAYGQLGSAQVISEQNEVTIYNVSHRKNETIRRYECIASNGYPPDVARSFHLAIHYAPEIDLLLDDDILSNELFFMNYNFNNEMSLKCRARMNPEGKIYWIKDKRLFNTNYQLYRYEDYIISEIIIRNNSQGEYTCVASNSIGIISKTIQFISLLPTTTTTITTTTTTTMSSTTTTMQRLLTAKHHRSKHIRFTTTVVTSTELYRMMTLSSKSIVHTYNMVLLILSIVHSSLSQRR